MQPGDPAVQNVYYCSSIVLISVNMVDVMTENLYLS